MNNSSVLSFHLQVEYYCISKLLRDVLQLIFLNHFHCYFSQLSFSFKIYNESIQNIFNILIFISHTLMTDFFIIFNISMFSIVFNISMFSMRCIPYILSFLTIVYFFKMSLHIRLIIEQFWADFTCEFHLFICCILSSFWKVYFTGNFIMYTLSICVCVKSEWV